MSCTGLNVETDKPSKYSSEFHRLLGNYTMLSVMSVRPSFFFLFTPTHNMVTSNSCPPHNTRIIISSGDSKVFSFKKNIEIITLQLQRLCAAVDGAANRPCLPRLKCVATGVELGKHSAKTISRGSISSQSKGGGRCYKYKCGCQEALEHGLCTAGLRHQHSSHQIIQLKKT